MGKIVAIGGGGHGSKHHIETINKQIVKLAQKSKPNLLFIPTASLDCLDYITRIKKDFENSTNLVDVLFLIKEKPDIKEIELKIVQADIIYVGGGNTLRMMRLWRKIGLDKLLMDAFEQNKVMCGVSAGSICWFDYGNSDSRKFKNPEADYIKVSGLGLINALHCPHYDSESDRKESLKKMMRKHRGVAIAIDDCVALQVVDDKYKIISSKEGANAYKVYWKNNKFYEEKLEKNEGFVELDQLLRK